MKWCFLTSHIPSLKEFLGSLAKEVLRRGDDCLVLADSKIGEYVSRRCFPEEARFLSKVDWCKENFQKDEKDFDSLSWKEFFPDFDRFRFFNKGFENSLETISQQYQFLDAILSEERPDAVIFEPPSGNFSEVAFYLCKKYRIPYLGLILSRLPGRTDVYDSESTYFGYRKDFEKIVSVSKDEERFARDFVEKFINHKFLPSYMKYQNLSGKGLNFKDYIKKSMESLPHWLKYISQRSQFKEFDSVSEMQLWHRICYPGRILKIKIKKLFQGNIFCHLKKGDKFFLFPLHIQPEASTSVLATYFYDQLNTVKNIAFCLPLPYKLYVKEHPAVRGDRPINFYKELKRIPNVVLISPSENVKNLIKNSNGVITLTSTIGLEAALSGKLVYVLGNVFYSFHPLCRKIKGGFEELKEEIRNDLGRPPASDLDNINYRFLASYKRNTIEGDLQGGKINNYRKIYEEIKEKFL